MFYYLCVVNERRRKNLINIKKTYKTYKTKVMKTQTTNLLNQLNKTQMDLLTMEVKETLALGFTIPVAKTFSSADLWNIQRQQRTSISRRRYL